MTNLAAYGFCHILSVMDCWRFRRVFSLVLGILLALGMSLSTVQAGSMVVKMASMASDMGAPVHGGCDGCAGDDGKTMTGACLSICTTQALAELPPAFSASLIPAGGLLLLENPVLPGRASSPDPYPPRPTDLI